MLLDDKVAVIYGGGGAIGGAIARAFAAQGASVYLTGRTERTLAHTAQTIAEAGGSAQVAVVDALNETAVDGFTDDVAHAAGRIDVSVNVIGYQDVQRPLDEISVDNFLQPVLVATRSQFLTTRAAARYMVPRSSGVILTFGGSGPQTLPGLGGFKVALDAVESVRRQWAVELGAHGIRVVSLKTGGIPESIPASQPGVQKIAEEITRETLLGRAATLADVGSVAAFLVSDEAATITATEINISAGALVD